MASTSLLDVEFVESMTINGRKPHTQYEINVYNQSGSWVIFKRYSDFQALNDALHHLIENDAELKRQNITLDELPRRRIFGGMSSDVVSHRKHKLETYIKSCLKYRSLCQQPQVLDFLNVPEEVKVIISSLKTTKQFKKSSKNSTFLSNTSAKPLGMNEQKVNQLLDELVYTKDRSRAIKQFEVHSFIQIHLDFFLFILS